MNFQHISSSKTKCRNIWKQTVIHFFYNELCNDTEQQIYLYSHLAQYYLEIGADQSGYEMILTARHLKNFYKIQDPVIRSQALHAYGRFLINKDYKQALEFNREYGKVARKVNFITKKAPLSKKVMFALPSDMVHEKEQLFTELAFDADSIAQTFLKNYTSLTGKKLDGIIEKLRQTNEDRKLILRILNSLFIIISSFEILLLLILSIYSETQIDGLTKLKNRRALNIGLGKFATSERKYSAIMIDIDNFKN